MRRQYIDVENADARSRTMVQDVQEIVSPDEGSPNIFRTTRRFRTWC
jgi:hypothetical protein